MKYSVIALVLASSLLWSAQCKTPEKKEATPAVAKEPAKKGPSYLGIVYLPTQKGARVVDVMPESPAARAGITAGDIIVKANGAALTGADSLKRQVFSQPPGTEVELTVMRARKAPMTITAVLEQWDGRMPYEMRVEP